eukprot:2455519-Prymnesium_polylepis.1
MMARQTDVAVAINVQSSSLLQLIDDRFESDRPECRPCSRSETTRDDRLVAVVQGCLAFCLPSGLLALECSLLA